jgi:hypothetical protein
MFGGGNAMMEDKTKRTRNWRSAAKNLSPATWLTAAKVIVAVIGLALLAFGVAKVTGTAGDTGVVTLIIVGALLLVSPFLIGQVEGLSVSVTSINIRFARDISELGAPKAAQILRHANLASFAETYAFIHEELAHEEMYWDAKIKLQDSLVRRCAAISSRERFRASEVRRLFRDGPPMIRVLALGLMQGDPSLVDGATIKAALLEPRSNNEQYQGLLLARDSWAALPAYDRQITHKAIKSADMPPVSGRRDLADKVLKLPVYPEQPSLLQGLAHRIE